MRIHTESYVAGIKIAAEQIMGGVEYFEEQSKKEAGKDMEVVVNISFIKELIANTEKIILDEIPNTIGRNILEKKEE